MTEKQHINNKDVWIKIEPWHVHRDNPNIIPTEYFIATYYLTEPATNATAGEVIKDDKGKPELFESPVEALSLAAKKLQSVL